MEKQNKQTKNYYRPTPANNQVIQPFENCPTPFVLYYLKDVADIKYSEIDGQKLWRILCDKITKYKHFIFSLLQFVVQHEYDVNAQL